MKIQDPVVVVFLKPCVRCGQRHELDFRPLAEPIEGMTHWSICQQAGQPILRLIEPKNRSGSGGPILRAYEQDGKRHIEAVGTKDRKGGDPSEWPEDLRVREMPGASETPLARLAAEGESQ